MIVAFAGSSAPSGWALCDGAEVSQTTYSQLFGRIGTTWNTCTNPLTGSAYGAPAGGNFRLPDLRGTFLRGVGDFADATKDTLLAGWQDNQNLSHTHTLGRLVEEPTQDEVVIDFAGSGAVQKRTLTAGTGTPTAYDRLSINIAASGATESRPQNVGINYLIKLYDDAGPIIMSGSPFIGMNFSEEYFTSSSDFTAEINKAYSLNKATAMAVTLPAASLGAVINFKNIGAGLVTITRAGSDTIDGATSITLSQYQAIKMKCFATNLWGVY
jgi:microcystin-dependent protein